MAILIRPGKRFRKARAGNGAEILKKLEDYLKTASSEPVELLCGFWKDQSNAITYQELRQAVLDGELDEKPANNPGSCRYGLYFFNEAGSWMDTGKRGRACDTMH